MFAIYPHIDLHTIDKIIFSKDDFHLFPKLDGSNCQISCVDGELKFASKTVTRDKIFDIGCFVKEYSIDKTIKELFTYYPNIVVYGEFLGNRKRVQYMKFDKFHIFDVFDKTSSQFYDYDEYSIMFEKFNISYIKKLDYDGSIPLKKFTETIQTSYLKPTDRYPVDEGLVGKRKGRFSFEDKGVSMFKIVNDVVGLKLSKPIIIENMEEQSMYTDIYCTNAYILKELSKIAQTHNMTEFDFTDSDERKKFFNIVGIKKVKSQILKDFVSVEIQTLKKDHPKLVRGIIAYMTKFIDVTLFE